MELVGTEISRPLNHLVVIRIAFIAADGHDVGFGQRYLVDLARLIQLVCDIGRFNHSDRDGVKAGALGIPVRRVFGKHLFVTLNVGGHRIAAVVPHIFIVHRLDSVDAQLIHQALSQRIHAGVGTNGIEVWFFGGAVINQSIIIRRLNVDHLAEDRALAGIQRISFFLGQALGVLIVLLCALDHLHRHGGVGRIIFIEVEHPLHSGQKVLSGNLSHLVSIDIYPGRVVAQVEGPGQTAVLGAPLLCDARNQLAVVVDLQQTVPDVGQILGVRRSFRVEQVKGSQLRGRYLRKHKVGDLLVLCLRGLSLGRVGGFYRLSAAAGFAFCSGLLLRSAAAGASAQNQGSSQRQSKQS